MSLVYLVVEGRTDAAMLRRLLPPRVRQKIAFVLGDGKSSAISTARTLLTLGDRPVGLLVDSDFQHPATARQRAKLRQLLHKASQGLAYEVFIAVPDLDDIYLNSGPNRTPLVQEITAFVENCGRTLARTTPTETTEIPPNRKVDPAELDTVVVPAQPEGFKETFLAKNRWYQIRIHPNMVPRIKYIAVYQSAPVSAITHVAPVRDIELWRGGPKYVLNFSEPAKEIGPLKLVPKPTGAVKAPQAPRYTAYSKLTKATNLDEAF
jgi:hypothetical protein